MPTSSTWTHAGLAARNVVQKLKNRPRPEATGRGEPPAEAVALNRGGGSADADKRSLDGEGADGSATGPPRLSWAPGGFGAEGDQTLDTVVGPAFGGDRRRPATMRAAVQP